ncbi:protein lines [Malaya genurostris]|uniref:protein lines n=1 Tax=Malaya genurostris TaxID=325434 RepID=UPI0026F3C5C1|nr:protein lines [Malaya genurostris]XP_058459622.1 protein lines [Malaya genurostris]XP_058459623.1 protein lines [Malaya genurostris]
MVLQNEKEPKKSLGSTLTGIVVTGTGGTTSTAGGASNGISTISSLSSVNEQPVSKRQRIENESDVVDSSNASSSGNSSNGSSLLASASSSSTSLSSSPPTSSGSSSSAVAVADTALVVDDSPTPIHEATNIRDKNGSEDDLLLRQVPDYQALFQEAIAKQCLCRLDTEVLLMSFQSYYVCGEVSPLDKGRGKVRQLLPLIEWPFEYLLKFLSNLQLLFDTYLKQNIKGNICSGIMDMCNYLIRSEHSEHLETDFVSMNIDEIIGLCNYNNKFINYLSGRILSSFLVIIKDDSDDRWLEKIVANLFGFNQADILAVKKINFSLEIIKQIVEWKDETEHPLDEDIHGQAVSSSNVEATSSATVFHPPPMESNYFATHFGSQQYGEDSSASTIFSPVTGSSLSNAEMFYPPSHSVVSQVSSQHASNTASSSQVCHIITLTDSESFDTTRIKCETICILGKKWSALVKIISKLIPEVSRPPNTQSIITETCILTFLRLWESIISVKANLSVVETKPFHSKLDDFHALLLSTENAVIYKQMLTLFNEALCYGSTLALQDFIPEEVGSLAHSVVRSVKDHRILDKMPKSTYTTSLGLLGHKGEVIRYHDNRLSPVSDQNGRVGTYNNLPGSSSSSGNAFQNPANNVHYDRTLMQKMALLVLKAVAVIVKEIRCDSSDSSVDSSDIDMQEIQMIERSIRDVVRKLESYLKHQLEFHPDSHFSQVLIHLFDDQDDYLVEAMVCTLDVTSGISFRNNAFPELIAILNPVYTFIEFSNLGPNITHLFLDLLISTETCFLLFLLRFLKYIRQNWAMFTQSCLNYYRHNSYSSARAVMYSNASVSSNNQNVVLDNVMTVLISLRLQISRLVADTIFPYNIGPILRLIENCESLYEGNELS